MTPADLGTTNVWLGIMAITMLVEFLMLLGAGLIGFQLYRAVTKTLQRLQETQINPVTAEARDLLDDVRDVLHRVQRMDDAVRRNAARAEALAVRGLAAAWTGAWPVRGIGRGLLTAVRAFVSGPSRPVGPRESHRAA